MKSFIKGYLVGILCGCVVGFFILIKASTSAPIILNDFEFTDLNDNRINLQDFKGKVVVLNIWATWCSPCIKEMPSIENLIKTLNDEDIIFLIASDEDVTKISSFKRRKKFDLPFYSFTKKPSATLSEARPQTFIFNRAGVLVYNRMGSFKWDDQRIIQKLKELLD